MPKTSISYHQIGELECRDKNDKDIIIIIEEIKIDINIYFKQIIYRGRRLDDGDNILIDGDTFREII